MEDSSKNSGKNEGNYKKILTQILISLIVATVASPLTTYIGICVQRIFARPQLTIEGVLPIHLYRIGTTISHFREHKLAFIFKVVNDAPTATIAHLGLIHGCVKLNWDIGAENNLPREQQIKREYIDDKRHERTIQRISISGIVRQDSQAIPQYGTGYVGVLFPLDTQGVNSAVPGSASLTGPCNFIKQLQTQPSLWEIFDIGAIHYNMPKGLRSEFKNNQLKISLLIGNDQIIVNSWAIKQLYSLPLSEWENLILGAMYENPEPDYFPTLQQSGSK